MRELEAERERRWKSEQATKKLVDHIKELQAKGEYSPLSLLDNSWITARIWAHSNFLKKKQTHFFGNALNNDYVAPSPSPSSSTTPTPTSTSPSPSVTSITKAKTMTNATAA